MLKIYSEILISRKYIVQKRTFQSAKVSVGCKPCIVLQGTEFEKDESMKRIGNLMVDWFRGAVIENVRLQGLELVISLTALEKKIYLRVYRYALQVT